MDRNNDTFNVKGQDSDNTRYTCLVWSLLELALSWPFIELLRILEIVLFKLEDVFVCFTLSKTFNERDGLFSEVH